MGATGKWSGRREPRAMDPSFYLQAWVETHEEPFLVIDEAFHVVTANRAYERSFGCARGSAEGKLCFELSHRETEPCEQRGEDCPLAYARSTGCSHSCLHAHYDADGEVRLVRVHLSPIIAADGNRYYAESVEEIQSAERPTGRGVGEPQMVGRSSLFLEVMEVLNAASLSAAPVLMAGERGTCKEHAARFIHYHSERSTGPFLGVNCAAVPEPLLESELFGHEGGWLPAASTGVPGWWHWPTAAPSSAMRSACCRDRCRSGSCTYWSTARCGGGAMGSTSSASARRIICTMPTVVWPCGWEPTPSARSRW